MVRIFQIISINTMDNWKRNRLYYITYTIVPNNSRTGIENNKKKVFLKWLFFIYFHLFDFPEDNNINRRRTNQIQ